jgi:hypothetical protein
MECSFHNVPYLTEVINTRIQAEDEGVYDDSGILYPVKRKSNLNMNKTLYTNTSLKILVFNTSKVDKTIDSSELTDKKPENDFSCMKYRTIETGRKSNSGGEDDDEESRVEPKMSYKHSVLKNLLYLYDEEVNKIKLNIDKKYSRNRTSLNELKKGIQNSVIKINDELSMLQSIDNNAKELKFNLIEKSIITVLGKIDDAMYRKRKAKKKDLYYSFLKFGFKNTIKSYIEKTVYKLNNEEKFQLPIKGVNYNIDLLFAYRINNIYYDMKEKLLCKVLKQDYTADDKPLITYESTVETDNEDVRLTTTMDSPGAYGKFIRDNPKRRSLFSYMNFFKSNPFKNVPHPSQLGFSNLTFYNKNLKLDQQEINKSLNSTRDMINRSDSSDESSTDYYPTLNNKEKSSNQLFAVSPVNLAKQVKNTTMSFNSQGKVNMLPRKSLKMLIYKPGANNPLHRKFSAMVVNSSNLGVKEKAKPKPKEDTMLGPVLLKDPTFFETKPDQLKRLLLEKYISLLIIVAAYKC